MIDGALLLDKPVGLSSNAALQRARSALGAPKAGHAGTLDPLASGLLLLLFGEGTKFAGPLLDADKEYLATLKLGERTATGDAEGEVLEAKPLPPDLEARLPAALAKFRGEIEQVPPMYSALKQGGVPLYEKARRGETVERAARRVKVLELEALGLRGPLLELRVRCSKGTYVRTLAEDLGEALGTAAHLTGLRRTRSGSLRVEDAIALAKLESLPQAERRAAVVPLEALLAGMPRMELDTAQETRFRHGQALPFVGEGLFCVYGAQGRVIGLGRADGSGSIRPARLVASG